MDKAIWPSCEQSPLPHIFIEHAAAIRKIRLSEMSEEALETMIKNLEGNIELTIPRRDYAGFAAERLIADYGLVQAGFALTTRRLETLN